MVSVTRETYKPWPGAYQGFLGLHLLIYHLSRLLLQIIHKWKGKKPYQNLRPELNHNQSSPKQTDN